jgi:hypothetical protein
MTVKKPLKWELDSPNKINDIKSKRSHDLRS